MFSRKRAAAQVPACILELLTDHVVDPKSWKILPQKVPTNAFFRFRFYCLEKKLSRIFEFQDFILTILFGLCRLSKADMMVISEQGSYQPSRKEELVWNLWSRFEMICVWLNFTVCLISPLPIFRLYIDPKYPMYGVHIGGHIFHDGIRLYPSRYVA